MLPHVAWCPFLLSSAVSRVQAVLPVQQTGQIGLK